MSENSYFTVLRLPGLKIEIHAPEGPPLPSDDDELEGLLDVAIDNAAYEGDWSGLVLLRQCLLKWADETQDALTQIAKEGPYKSAIARDHAA